MAVERSVSLSSPRMSFSHDASGLEPYAHSAMHKRKTARRGLPLKAHFKDTVHPPEHASKTNSSWLELA